jgi:hypothetical protein
MYVTSHANVHIGDKYARICVCVHIEDTYTCIHTVCVYLNVGTHISVCVCMCLCVCVCVSVYLGPEGGVELFPQ